jgi:hypothetical protein
MSTAQTELLGNLSALRAAVGSTTTLKTILDDGWFDGIEQAIGGGSKPADPSGFLYDFSHPLRGVPSSARTTTNQRARPRTARGG